MAHGTKLRLKLMNGSEVRGRTPVKLLQHAWRQTSICHPPMDSLPDYIRRLARQAKRHFGIVIQLPETDDEKALADACVEKACEAGLVEVKEGKR